MKRVTSLNKKALVLENPELKAEFVSMGITSVEDLITTRFDVLIRSPIIVKYWDSVVHIVVTYWKSNYPKYAKL